MGREKTIAPEVAVRFYEGDEEMVQSLEVLALGTTKNNVMKTALKEYIVSEKQKELERTRARLGKQEG